MNPFYLAMEKGIDATEIGDWDKVIAYSSEAIRLDPTNARAYCSRGMAYGENEEWDKAIADFTESIRLDPLDGLTYMDRGVTYGEKQEWTKEDKDFDMAKKLDKNPELPGRDLLCHQRGIN
jgi:tetratricopeptide (TPR) repeat protein